MNFKTIFRTAVLLSALCADSAFADVTINVKATDAPYLYVWDTADTKYNGEWPGAVMSDTKVHDGVTYWTKTFTGVSQVNAIFNCGDGQPQSGDFVNLTGEVYFEYDGGSKAWGVMPSKVIYESGINVYYVDMNNWSQVNVHVYNGGSNNGWPGQEMTPIGQDQAGYNVYKAKITGLAFTPTNIIFSNNGNNQTPSGVTFTSNGYYCYLKVGNSGYSLETLSTITSDRLAITASNFPDENFRAALGTALGITLDSNNENASQAFSASDIEVLDLTNKGITSLSGIEHFTGLKELYAGQNNIRGGDLGDLTHLEVLDFHANTSTAFVGFTSTRTYAQDANLTFFYIAPTAPLRYLDMSDCPEFAYLRAITNSNTSTACSTLETLKVANCSKLGWSNAYNSFTNIKHLDLSNSNLSTTSFTGTNLTHLEYLDLSDNSLSSFAMPAGLSALTTLKVSGNSSLTQVANIGNAPNLVTLDMHNCPALIMNTNNQLSSLKGSVHTSLETLDISNCALSTPDAISGFPSLKTLNISGNKNITTFTATNNALTNIDITGCTKLASLNLSNNQFTTIPDPVNTSLHSLEIGGNPFPATITQQINATYGLRLNNCPTVTSIDLSGSNISGLMLGGMTGLQTLKINDCPHLHKTAVNNNDTNLKSGLGCLYIAEATNLQTIEAANCNFGDTKLTQAQHPWNAAAESSIPSFTIPSGFNALKTLKLSGNSTLSIVHDITNAPNLEVLDVHGCAAFSWRTQHSTLTGLTGENHQHLASLDFSNCDINVSPVVVSGFPALATLNIADNPKVTEAQLSGNALTSLDISGCTNLATVDVSGNEFSNINFLNVPVNDLDISRNNITSLSGISNASLETLRINGSHLTSLAGLNKNNFSSLKTLYANNNDFAGALSLSGTGLEQIDLSGNTGITSLDAKNNNLNSMLLQGCSGLTTLDVSGNAFTNTGTGTTLTTGMLNISDLELTELNLSDNKFTTIGANSSLAGMASTLTKLEARNNAFTDFRNGKAFPKVSSYTYTDEDGHTYTVTRAAKSAQTSANHISDLAALEWLDLSGNQSLDSVCLFFNPALKHLDLHDCHTSSAPSAEYRTKVGDKETSNTLGLKMYHHPTDGHGGLYSLNLMKNTALEWLDVSNTAIHETAVAAISCGKDYSEGGGYMYIHELPNLETLLCNNNAMNSFGLKQCPKLKHVEAQRMNGQSKIMRDGGANPGNINLHANVNGDSNSIEYFDVSNSGFSEVGVASGCLHSAIKTLIVDGNPLDGLNASTPGLNLRNGDALTDCRTPDLETLSAVGCTDLTEVNVNYCQKLTSVDLTGDTNIKSLKMMNCVGLTAVPALEEQSILVLETLMCGYNTNLSNLNVSSYTALKTLNCQDDNIPALDLSKNLGLVSLYASNNRIETLTVPSKNIMNVAVDNNGMFALKLGTEAPNLTNLDFSNNHICAIDLSGAGNLLTSATVFAENNSRTLRASLVQFVQTPGATEPVDLYFFQMDDETAATGYNTTSILNLNCVESASHYMGADGFDIAKASNWTGATAIAGTRQNADSAPRRVASTADITKVANDPSSVYGNILALADESTPLTYDYATGNSSVPTVSLGMAWTSQGAVVTAVNDLSADKAVSSVEYVNVAGAVSDRPFDGVNIVVTTYADGTRTTTKVLR